LSLLQGFPRKVEGMSKVFDPWRAEQQAVWRNRYAQVRNAPAEPLFHAFAYAALAALLAPWLFSALADNAPAIRAAISHHRAAACLVATAMLAWQQMHSRASRTRVRKEGWLAAQPVSIDTWRRNARFHAAALCAMQFAALALSGLALRLTLPLFLGAAGCAVFAGLLALAWPGIAPGFSRPHGPIAPVSATASAGAGRIWRWQLQEARAVLGPRRFSSMFFVLLLIPANSPLQVALFTVLAGLGSLLLAAAWLRSILVLVQAQQWLLVQPVHAGRLLREWLPLPAAIGALALLVLALALSTLGATKFILPASLCVVVISSLAMACVAAERGRPRRIPLLLVVQLLLLTSVFQVFPPALAICYPAQLAWLVRRSLAQ
jgi:hypothetical protein